MSDWLKSSSRSGRKKNNLSGIKESETSTEVSQSESEEHIGSYNQIHGKLHRIILELSNKLRSSLGSPQATFNDTARDPITPLRPGLFSPNTPKSDFNNFIDQDLFPIDISTPNVSSLISSVIPTSR
jgi:hypothetical protein